MVSFHKIDLPKKKITEFCKKWNIIELALFGSVLTDNFGADSDIDVLVTFSYDCGYSLFDLAQMQIELENILAHEVDLVEKAALSNPFRKQSILNNMEVIYAA
jgi:predicted nucleotidyltransferase